MEDFRSRRNPPEGTESRTWAYQHSAVPGVFIIPPPPVLQENYPTEELWRWFCEVTNVDSDAREYRTGRVSNGLHRTVSEESSSSQQGNSVNAQHSHEGLSGPSHSSHLGLQPRRWLSVRRPKHKDHSHSSDQSHAAHDVDDSFFIHTNEQPPESQNIILPGRVSSPVSVEIPPSADYARMMIPSTSSEADKPMNYYIYRISQFIRNVKKLPWSSSRLTYDYYPGRGHQRFHHDPYADDEWKHMSWYARLRRRSIDLLSSESGETAPSDSALAYPPDLSYGHGDSGIDGSDSNFYLGLDQVNYPNNNVPQTITVDTGQMPPTSWPIYGPLIPSDDEKTYPNPWSPPPPIDI